LIGLLLESVLCVEAHCNEWRRWVCEAVSPWIKDDCSLDNGGPKTQKKLEIFRQWD